MDDSYMAVHYPTVIAATARNKVPAIFVGGHRGRPPQRQLRAMSGLMHHSKNVSYSIISSASARSFTKSNLMEQMVGNSV
jgi:hypothetical protein